MFRFCNEPDWEHSAHFEHHCNTVVRLLGHVVKVIRDPVKIDRNVSVLGLKHSVFEVSPDQFDYLGEMLLIAFEEVLAESFTVSAKSGWAKIYRIMSIMIQENMKLYDV